MLSHGCRLLLLFLVLLYGVSANAANLQNLRYNRMPDKVQLVLDPHRLPPIQPRRAAAYRA